MVKSSGACFKIIACGSDSVDHEDLQAPESKSSNEKRGWSFRKRSARHRVLSNTISEAPSSVKKESPESTDVNFVIQSNFTIPEKSSADQRKDEKAVLSAQPNIKLSDTIADNDPSTDEHETHDESSIIVIQSAIRRSLAQRLLSKQKKVIKLQAAIRGHIVRTHAVGTLRCVQAIVKMQALVRARRARLLVEESGDFEKQSASQGKDNPYQSFQRSEREAKPNGSHSYISIEKLLSNGFTRQLMESTPKSKYINLKCDPSRSDLAWKWLERWMSVSSVSNTEVLESGSAAELLEKNYLEHSDRVDSVVPSNHYPEQTNVPGVRASVKASVNNDNLISCEEDSIDPQVCKSISPSSSHPDLQNIDKSDLTHAVTETGINLEPETNTEPVSVETKETNLNLEVDTESLPDKEETVHEIDLPEVKILPSEQPEIETKKLSRKSSNPAFLAAQSKFEELSSVANNVKLEASFNLDHGIDYNLDKVSTSADQQFRSQVIESSENPISNVQAVQKGGSECGTELSISSTLDSPDRSDVGVYGIEQNPKKADEFDHSTSGENFVIDINGTSSVLGPDQSHKNVNHSPRDDSGNSVTVECNSSEIPTDSPPLERKPEPDPSYLQLELGSEASNLVHKQSPEASPRSHTTVTESQATPSRIVSLKSKKKRGEKSESSCKKMSSSADKQSLLNSNQDSASRSSMEQLPKEHKAVKRRDSFGSAQPDNADQEPRDSSSSNSLPSYMQATESARAKAISSGSPRSSPDVHAKDIYVKKRQSLPGSNGRQGSPHIQRSLSQAQQNTKGTGTHSPQGVHGTSAEIYIYNSVFG